MTENEVGLPGDPHSPLLRDLKGYRVYRDTNLGFVPDAPTRIVEENQIPDRVASTRRPWNAGRTPTA